MPRLQPLLALIIVAGVATAIAPRVRADTGVQLGARGGVQLLEDDDLGHQHAATAGAEVRFGFELSPLVVALSFDNYFVENRTLFQIGANALYDLPLGHSFLHPYVGAGVGVTRFALPEREGAPAGGPSAPGAGNASDSNGMRFGLNLVSGVRFDHVDVPLVRPFVQGMVSVGRIDLLTVVGGVLFELDGP